MQRNTSQPTREIESALTIFATMLFLPIKRMFRLELYPSLRYLLAFNSDIRSTRLTIVTFFVSYNYRVKNQNTVFLPLFF